MFAVVQVGGSQFKVGEGDNIDINGIDEKEGKSVTLDKVLMFADGHDIRVGQPFLKEVKITATVLKHFLNERVISYKYRRRKNSAWKKGHRQQRTSLNITKIAVQ